MMEAQTNSAAATVAGLTAPPPLTLSDLIQPVLRRKLLLFIVMALFLSVAFGVLAVVEPRYTATAVIMVQPTDADKLIGDANGTQRPLDLEEVRSQIEVLRSRALLTPIVEKLGVALDAEFDPALHTSMVSALKQRIHAALEPVFPELAHLFQPAKEKPFDPVDMLLERLQVTSLNRSHALSVSLEMQNPRLVMETVNAIAEAYRSQTLFTKSSATAQARQQLDERIAEIEQTISRAERRIEDLRTGAGIIQGRSSNLTAEAVSEVNAELFRVRSQANTLTERQTVIERSLREGGDLSSAIDLSGSQIISALRQREADARARVAQLAQYYGNLNPRIVAARSELVDIRESIRAELGKMQSALTNELAVVQQRQAALQREADQLAAEAATTSKAEQEIRSLEREIADAHTMLSTFISRQNRLEVQSNLAAPDAEILTLAGLPIQPSFPNKPIVLGLALVTSLIFGLALIAVIEGRDNSFRTLSDLERLVPSPITMVMPSVTGRAGRAPELEVLAHPRSLYSEAAKQLLASLCRSVHDRTITLMVTSALSGEGKTTSAVTLARLGAVHGLNTLLVDGDLRRRGASRLLAMKNDPGLCELLTTSAAVDDIIRVDPASGIHVLPAGGVSGVSEGALNSARLRQVFQALESRYDLIVIDTAPILAVYDAQYYSDVANRVLFVVRWGQTPRDVVKAALKLLTGMGTTVDGTALTRVDTARQARYGTGEYGAYKSKLRDYHVKA